jgi:hypothetical protein
MYVTNRMGIQSCGHTMLYRAHVTNKENESALEWPHGAPSMPVRANKVMGESCANWMLCAMCDCGGVLWERVCGVGEAAIGHAMHAE